jgi:hypothetical protein
MRDGRAIGRRLHELNVGNADALIPRRKTRRN